MGASALGVLREFSPASWFHPRGIYRVRAKLEPRLPDVAGTLFLTFTVNPLLFADPLAAFEHARDRLRRMFFKLRHGAVWEGKRFVVDAPYAIKVEFHRSGWVHFHVVFLTRRYVPGALLNALWSLGRANVQRISNQKFRYLLKYVTKGGSLPPPPQGGEPPAALSSFALGLTCCSSLRHCHCADVLMAPTPPF